MIRGYFTISFSPDLPRVARRAALVFLLAALVAGSLVACGDGAGEPAQTGQTPGTAPANTPTPVSAPDSGSPSGDRGVLIALYDATDGPNWDDNTNWLSEAPLGSGTVSARTPMAE